MTQSALREDVHYCARCREIIAEEKVAEEKKAERDSGVMPSTTLRGVAMEPPPAPLPTIPIAPLPETEPEGPLPEIVPATELRAAPRKQVEVDIGIHSDSHFFTGLTGDVSRGGLFVATYAEIPVGSKITLDFELPNGKIVVEGTVRWQRAQRDHQTPGFGVQFENVEPTTLKLIERFCQARPPLYYDQADDL